MLGIIERFFFLLEEKNIPYVQWKSNERLSEFAEGEGDLDLLFYPDDKPQVKNLLAEIGALEFEALPLGKYPNIDDFLVVDADSGKLIHFHVHFQLDIGETGVKRYPLPWISEIINNGIRHESVPIWITSHEHELLLLLVREALRIHPVKVKYFPSRHKIESKSFDEFAWLRTRTNKDRFEKAASSLLAEYPDALRKLSDIFDNGLSKNTVRELWGMLEGLRRKYRTSTDTSTVVTLLKNRFSYEYKKWMKKMNIFYPQKRIKPDGGLIIAITGSDGAGKSTIVQSTANILGRKLDTETVYLGMPKPEKSRFPVFVKMIYAIRMKRIWNLMVKKSIIRKALNLQKKGVTVICDRYPQAQFPGIMDGPLSAAWMHSKNPVKKGFARYEKNVFKSIQSQKVDLMIKLTVDAETSHKRGKLPLELASQKTEVVNRTDYPGAKNIFEINTAETDVDGVIKQTMNYIWETFRKTDETS
jgi:thymidylate kinase